jgi:hypothetical protein
MNDGSAMTGRYTVTCPYCATRIMANQPRGVFDLVSDAAKALNRHLRYACSRAPRLRTEQRDRLASTMVKSVDDEQPA